MNEVVLKWLERAKEDLQLVENEMKMDEPLYTPYLFISSNLLKNILKPFLSIRVYCLSEPIISIFFFSSAKISTAISRNFLNLQL